MVYIRLIRHGQTDWNLEMRTQGWTDVPLNEKGIEEAKDCSHQIIKEKWDLIVTSPLKRALMTTQIINESMQLPIIEMEQFKERHYGDVEGMLRQERKEKYPNNEYPNSETRSELTERAMSGLNHLLFKYPNNNILIVTHGGTINAILSHISKGKYGFDKTKINNLSFTDLKYESGQWHILKING